MYVCMYVRVNGWVCGGGWVDRWVVGRQMNAQISRWGDRWMNGQMDEYMNEVEVGASQV